jgi:hypothetical protein
MAPRFKRTSPHRPPPGPPDGVAAAVKCLIQLYDQQDGEGVEWKMIAETLFKAGFKVLDDLPDYEKRAVAKRVHAGSYDRMAGNPIIDSAPSKTGPGDGVSGPSITAGFKSSGPGPEKAP